MGKKNDHPLYNGDRFELEQRIIRVWQIVDDLKHVSTLGQVDKIADYYDLQLQQLWDLFENMIHTGQFKSKE